MNDEYQSSVEMPRYKCHKEVWALKIKAIVRDIDKAREEQRETDGTAVGREASLSNAMLGG